MRQRKKRKVHSLIDKVYSRKNLELAWKKVKQNRGSAGIDELSICKFEERKHYYLELLHQKLRDRSYRPKPVKRVEIPKPDGGIRKLVRGKPYEPFDRADGGRANRLDLFRLYSDEVCVMGQERRG